MKKIVILLSFLGCSYLVFSQPKNISGDWLLESITREEQAEESHPYEIMTFSKNGKLCSAAFFNKAIASWKFNKETATLHLTSFFDDPEFSGSKKVSFPDDNIMIIAMTPHLTYHFKKLNWESINFNHEQSGLLGIWRLAPLDKKDASTVNILVFEKNGKYRYINSSTDGMTKSSKGIWLYNHLEKDLLIGGSQMLSFMGMSRVLEVTSEKLVIKTSQGKLEAKKITAQNKEIEPLYFNENFQSDDTDKLPVLWTIFDKMLSSLAPIRQLTYDLGVKIENVEVLKHSRIVKKLKVKEQSVSFSNIHITPTDTMQYSENYKGNMLEMNNYFFPEAEPDKFRVVGKKEITVPAGTFICTVVEAISDKKKLKYWMIDNQPGIYAKIIVLEKSRFTNKTDYKITKLIKIDSL